MANFNRAEDSIKNPNHPNLTVYGFIRKHYPFYVPVALRTLLESYYSLWIHRELTHDECKQLLALEHNQTMDLDVNSTLVHGSKVLFWLKCTKKEVFTGSHGNAFLESVRISLCVTVESDVEFIAGKFDLILNGDRVRCKPEWERRFVSGDDNLTFCNRKLIVSKLGDTGNLTVSCYLDLTQMKFKGKRTDFDLTPNLIPNCRVRWLVKGKELETLMSGRENRRIFAEFEGGWKLSIIRRQSSISLSTHDFRIWVGPAHLPLDVSACHFRYSIRYEAGDQRGETDVPCERDYILPQIDEQRAIMNDEELSIDLVIEIHCKALDRNFDERNDYLGYSLRPIHNVSYNK